MILILENVIFLLLFNNTQNDVLKIFPRFPNVNFTELFHSRHELNVRDMSLYDRMVGC